MDESKKRNSVLLIINYDKTNNVSWIIHGGLVMFSVARISKKTAGEWGDIAIINKLCLILDYGFCFAIIS